MTTTAVNSAPNVHGQIPGKAPATRPEMGALRILVLDNGDQRGETADRLRADGFDVVFSDSAESFVGEIQASSPDAVVLDVQMGGIETLRKVRGLEIQVPIVAIADKSDPEPARIGATAVLSKPVDPATLSQKLRQAIGDGRLPREMHLGDEGCPFELPADGVDLEAVERGLLAQALVRTNGNQSRAARLLGISRYALRYRMQKFNLS